MADARHVLIIEDEILVGMDVLHCLTEIGFETFAFAGTQVQALEQARLKRPDLVTVDVGLLNGDGRATADALQQELGRLSVIFITGDPEALSGSPDAVIVRKPFGPAELADAWRRCDLQSTARRP